MGYLTIFENCTKKQDPGGSFKPNKIFIQGVFEMRAEILTTSYWLHVELGKNT
jgi:hypothetical protein